MKPLKKLDRECEALYKHYKSLLYNSTSLSETNIIYAPGELNTILTIQQQFMDALIKAKAKYAPHYLPHELMPISVKYFDSFLKLFAWSRE